MSISTKNKHNHLLMFILTLRNLRCYGAGCGLDGQPLCADHCLLCSRRTVTFFTGKP